MNNSKIPFPFLEVPSRSEKPRTQGLTIFADINLSVREVTDLMEHQAELLDYAKIVDHGAMIARYHSDWLRQKVEKDPSNARILVTEGGGYKLVP